MCMYVCVSVFVFVCGGSLGIGTVVLLLGLSKERPILDHHAKAHILDFMKSGGFQIRRISKDQLPGMVSPMLLKLV